MLAKLHGILAIKQYLTLPPQTQAQAHKHCAVVPTVTVVTAVPTRVIGTDAKILLFPQSLSEHLFCSNNHCLNDILLEILPYYHRLVMTNQSESFIEIQITPVPVYITIVKIISDPSTCVSAVIICKL